MLDRIAIACLISSLSTANSNTVVRSVPNGVSGSGKLLGGRNTGKPGEHVGGRGRERKMALVKRGKTWHTDFVVNGQRFRQSLKTTDWREAQSEEEEADPPSRGWRTCSGSEGIREARLP